MTANEIARQKYLQLIDHVETLEDQVADLEKLPATDDARAGLTALQEKLSAARLELTRVSDGCGTPHAR